MKYDISHAIPLLRPNSQWVLIGDSYEGLDWRNGDAPPTEQELLDKVQELQDAEAMRLLRIERDRRLKEVDWVVTKAYSQNLPLSTEWANYMQGLRDLPATATPGLNSSYNLDLDSVTWPVKPS